MSIKDLLLESGERTVEASKYTEYIEKLEVFSPTRPKRKRARDGEYAEKKETCLNRHWIDAFQRRDYVALSYTWGASEHEDDDDKARPRTYFVEKRSRDGVFYESPVRDVVFDRVIKYMKAVDAKYFWIDRHSIKQRTKCDQPNCNHGPCIQKKEALHVVDLVYKQSAYPVALLGRVVETASELVLLHDLLEGKLAIEEPALDGKYYSIIDGKEQQAEKTLQLLRDITSDLWWTRAWTFQENYRGADRMELLMRHAPSLDNKKRKLSVFGCIEGELCISSVEFSTEASRLCRALSPGYPILPEGERGEMVRSVLDALGRYTVLLGEEESMSTAIIENVNSRGLQDPWDRLSIIANCCQYSRRIEWPETRGNNSHGRSLSAALMAQYLVNGEILYNGKYSSDFGIRIGNMSVAQALKNLSFDGFRAPLTEANRSRSHNKRCRLFEPRIEHPGIIAKGHLWELGTIINTAGAYLKWVDNPRTSDLSLECCKRLEWLAHNLEDRGCQSLPWELRKFINTGYSCEGFSNIYMGTMAEEVSDAIADGKSLSLGRLWQGHGQWPVAYSAIFILDEVCQPQQGHDYSRYDAYIFQSRT